MSHAHSHGLVHESIKRSHEGIRAVLVALGVLAVTAVAQALVFVLSGSVALLADLIHNVGDALSRLGRAKEARVSYRRAAALCREELSVRPDNAPTLATLAIVESKLGAAAEADRDIKRAVSLAPDDAEVRYAEAVVDARAGRADQAVAALGAAVSAGYSPLRAQKDPELLSLKTHPSFAAALEPSKGKGGRT